jgi:hypothetical protein
MTMKHWQEEGIRLAGMLIDAVEIIHLALPRIHQKQHRRVIEHFLTDGSARFPSPEALRLLEAAIIAAGSHEIGYSLESQPVTTTPKHPGDIPGGDFVYSIKIHNRSNLQPRGFRLKF